MTGAGAGSIGAEVLQGLISGGARVVVTTSRFSREVTEYYQAMYSKFGSRGSQLIVVPFNQGMNFVLAIYILKLMNSQEANRMSRPSLTTSMMRRMALVGILTMSFPSLQSPKTAVRSMPLTPGQSLPIASC